MCASGEKIRWRSGHGSSMAAPQKAGRRLATGPRNPTSGDMAKRIQSGVLKRCVAAHVHSRVIHKGWKQPKWPSTDGQTEWAARMAYDPGLERKGILAPAATWVNPEDVPLSEISQTQKDKDCMIPLGSGP